jgi:integrase
VAKRGNNEGTIYKRTDGRWLAQLTVPGGKRKSFYGATREEARRKLAAALHDLDRGIQPAGERQTVAQYVAHWLEVARPTIKPRTWIRYEQLLRKHTMPMLGRTALARLTPQQVQALYAAKITEGLSPTTVHHLHAVLHRALDQAWRWGLIARNPCDLVDAPHMGHHEMQVFTPAQARTFLDAIQGHRYEALFTLALTTGMHQGELLGLHWSDVDLDSASVQVRTNLQRYKGTVSMSTPKTAHSRRQLTLSLTAIEALRRHRTRQVEERLALGADWQDQDLVFPNSTGKPANAGYLLRSEFYPLLERAGLPKMRFHDLRHSAATLMLGSGVHPKIASEVLGHARTGTTMDLYSHTSMTMQRDASAAMDRLLGR